MKNKYKGLFGEFSGRIGNLIIYELNGQTVIRSRPAGPQKKATGKRKEYQNDFKHVMKLMQMAKLIVKIGFAEEDKKGTGFKKALGYNLKKYRHLERPTNLEWLELSQGELSSAIEYSSHITVDHKVKISWNGTEENKKSFDNDRLLVLLVNEKTHETSHLYQYVYRNQGSLIMDLPPHQNDETIRAFVCFFQHKNFDQASKNMISNSSTFLVSTDYL